MHLCDTTHWLRKQSKYLNLDGQTVLLPINFALDIEFNDNYRVWTDGDSLYLSIANMFDAIVHYTYDKNTFSWSRVEFNNCPWGYGEVWTDGTNIYASQDNTTYLLDKETKTCNRITMTGFSGWFSTDYLWSDGKDVFYSYNSSSPHFKLIKDEFRWEQVEWSGIPDNLSFYFTGRYFWTNGENTYFSYNEYDYADEITIPHHYKINTNTYTWEPVEWNIDFYGDDVWTDGHYTYCTVSGSTYKLNISGEWELIKFNAPVGSNYSIVSDGTNQYCINYSNDQIYIFVPKNAKLYYKNNNGWEAVTL